MNAVSSVRPLRRPRRLWSLHVPHDLFVLALGYGCFRGGSSLAYTAGAPNQGSGTLFIANADFTLWTTLLVAVGACIACLVGIARPACSPLATSGRSRKRAAARIALTVTATVAIVLVPLGALLAGDSSAPVSGTLYAAGSLTLSLLWLCTLVRHGAASCLGALVGAMGMLSVTNLMALALGPGSRGAVAAGLLIMGTTLLVRAQTRLPGPAHHPEPNPLVTPAPHGFRPIGNRASVLLLRSELSALAVPLTTAGVLESVFGFLNGFLVGAELGAADQGVFTLGAAAGAVYGLMRHPAEVQDKAFRRWFPWIASVVAILPFAGAPMAGALGAAFGFLYIALSIQVAKCVLAAACARPTYALGILGATMGLRHLGRGLGIAAGLGLGHLASGQAAATQGLLAASLVSLYALGLALWNIERHQPRHPTDVTAAPDADATKAAPAIDPFEQRTASLARAHRLTLREQQICTLMARGRSATFIAGELSCTPGTVRTHAKNLYAKLGVHSKQELIDLFEGCAARDGTQ